MTNPILSKFFNINRPSVGLIILAWIAFNFNSIFLSYPVKFIELFLFFLSLFFLEIIFTLIANKTVKLLIVLNTFLFLFGFILILILNNLFKSISITELRGRIIFPILIIVLNFTILINKKIENYRIINVFSLIFIFINFSHIALVLLSKENSDLIFSNRKSHFEASKKTNSILFLVLDEYHSPDDLYSVLKDSSLYNFSNYLKENNWQTNTNFQSSEIWTVRSLSSLFIYNLSYDSNFIKVAELIPDYMFDKSYLSSDLQKKGVNLINWGWFNFGLTKSFYFYPSKLDFTYSLFRKVAQNTAVAYIFNNTNNLSVGGFDIDYSATVRHNSDVLNRLKDSIPLIKERSFIYAHLAMPHTPFYHDTPKFSLKEINLKNYVEYWKFTNYLILEQLVLISQSQNFKIVVTGDHGFRHDSRVNKNKTFLALYGFENINIKELKTVQELGSLINSNF